MDRTDGAALVVTDPEEAASETEDDSIDSERRACHDEVLKNFQQVGIALIVLGLCTIVCSAVTISVTWWHFGLATPGTWCGVFAVALGCMAVTVRFHLTKCVLIVNVILASFTSVLGAVNIIMSTWLAIEYLIDRGSVVVFSAIQCALAISWTVICIYHLIVTARILQLGVQSVGSYCPTGCPGFGMYPDPSYSRIPMAYIPGASPVSGQPQQTNFQVAPNSGTPLMS